MHACALALGLSFLFPPPQAPSSPPLVRKLNGPLLRRGTRDVTAFRLSPDGTRAYYLADVERDETPALLGVPVDGSGPAVQLSPSFGGNTRVDADFQVSPDGASVAFRMNSGFSFHVYAVPAAGGPLAVLDPGTFFGASVESGYRFSGDGTRVVYMADRSVDGVLELWSAATDGLTPPVRLNGALPAGGRVLDFALTPDGTQALYRADQSTDELLELFVVPVDGSAAPRRLNPNLVSGGDVAANYRVDPLGKRVVYVADQEVNNTFYLYSVSLDGSASAVRLMPTNTSQNFEPDFVITGDGQRVAYRFFALNSAKLLLFSAPIAGPAAAVPLTDPLGVALPGVQPGFRAGPGGEVQFRASTLVNGSVHLFSVRADGSAQPAQLDDLPATGAQVIDDFRFGEDGTRALFRTLNSTDFTLHLESAPHDGSTPPIDLTGPLAGGGNALAFAERAGRTTYVADQDVDEVQELYQVPSTGGAPAERLDTFVPDADVQLDFQVAPDGRTVLYRSDERRDETFELFTVSPGLAEFALNPPFPPSTDQVGPVGSFLMAGERVVYTQQTRTIGYSDLLSVPLHGGAPPVVLNPLPASPQVFLSSIRVTPDQRRVVYCANQDDPDKVELYSVPIDGSGPCVKKNGPLVANGDVRSASDTYKISADGHWVVYLADQRVDQQSELFAAPLDEDGEARLLTPMRTGRDVAIWGITPDSRTVVYIADQDFDERYELYSVPIDGSGPSVRIGAMQNAGGSAGRFEIASDSLRVVYLADQLRNDQFELFVTRVDGLTPSRLLNLPLTPKGDLRAFQTSDLEHVLYMADKDTPGVVQLFSVPLSGSSALGIELTPPLTRATDVVRSYLTPDGAWAFYVDTALQLWSVPVAGGSPARLLDGNFPDLHGLVTYDLQATTDSKRILYRADPALLQRWELFSVPVAGGAPPVRLHPPLIRQRRVELFGNAPGGRSVGFTAALEADGRQELYLSPADGSAPPRKMNARLVSGGSVESFAFGATENEAVYLADQDTNGAFELYVTTLPAPGGRVHPR